MAKMEAKILRKPIREWDLKIKTITKTEKKTKKIDSTIYTLVAETKLGEKVKLISIDPFEGLSARDGVISLKIETSQMSIKDFEKE